MAVKFAGENTISRVISDTKTLVSGKVDKVQGKGLSTNDYTDAEKTKLASLDVNGEAKQMGSYCGYKYVGVNSFAANKGWSMLLAEFLSNEESQVAVYKATGEGPSNKAALAEASSPALDALAEQSYYATLQRVGGNYWTPAESLGKNILEGNVSQQLLDDAVAGIEQPVDAAQ